MLELEESSDIRDRWPVSSDGWHLFHENLTVDNGGMRSNAVTTNPCGIANVVPTGGAHITKISTLKYQSSNFTSTSVEVRSTAPFNIKI